VLAAVILTADAVITNVRVLARTILPIITATSKMPVKTAQRPDQEHESHHRKAWQEHGRGGDIDDSLEHEEP
jgi:hypothetical protein